jgi:hypothetical protein
MKQGLTITIHYLAHSFDSNQDVWPLAQYSCSFVVQRA